MYSKHNRSPSSARCELRESGNPVGLLNVSNCCYLNSLLQCYFLLNDFVVEILKALPLENIERVILKENKTRLKRIKN